MSRVFVTAFEPYGRWSENASWLALVEFTKQINAVEEITTRLYPVDFPEVRKRLEADLACDYDYVLHLGQAPGSAGLQLEAVGLNVGGDPSQSTESYLPLIEGGAVAYRSSLPLAEWVQLLRASGIPATLSYHAGTYLCNATLYLTHYLIEQMGLKTKATFVHLPLATSQAISEPNAVASLSSEAAGRGIGLLVKPLVTQEPQRDQELA